MNNCEEITVPELKLPLCHVKEACRMLLHTVIFCRMVGLEPAGSSAKVFGFSYVKCNDPEIDALVEANVKKFADMLERSVGWQSAHLVLQFYFTKPRQPSFWNMLTGQDEKIVFEQWRIPVSVHQPRRSFEDLSGADELLQMAMQQQQKALFFSLCRLNQKTEHLPAHSYRFDVHVESPSDSTWSPRAFTQSMKRIPYIT